MKKILLPVAFILFGMTGCFSSDTQAEATANNAAPANTSPAKEYKEGKDYVEVFPEVNTDAADGKVEVVELFWLGCPHCYHLEPAMKKYKENKPDYVEFKQVPAVLNPRWAFHGKAFYVAKLVDPKNKKKLISEMFKEVHENKNPLNSDDKLKAFFAKHGISETQFNNTWNSMALSAAMSQAEAISKGSQATSVPTILINGKYRTSPSMANGEVNLMNIINKLTREENEGS